MGQADGHGESLRRVALQIANGGWYFFKVNPTNYAHNEPQRTTVIKTKSDIVIEDFGKDLETIVFSGTTGWAKDAKGKTGADRMRDLRKYLRAYATKGGDGNKASDELTFHNFTDNESYIVHLAPEGISLERDVEQPILYTYKLSLIVIRDAGDPPSREITDPIIGNESSSIGGKPKPSGNKKPQPRTMLTNRTGINTKGVDKSPKVINPRGSAGAYQYGVDEIKKQIGYGEG